MKNKESIKGILKCDSENELEVVNHYVKELISRNDTVVENYIISEKYIIETANSIQNYFHANDLDTFITINPEKSNELILIYPDKKGKHKLRIKSIINRISLIN